MVDRERIEELPFQRAANVACDDTGPVSGETVFCGVPYTFMRRPHDRADANEWGDWYDLNPVDPDSGLPMRAMGYFRSHDSVRWTSMGSTVLKETTDHRACFRGFIRRLIDETATHAHWNAFCVAHYPDDVVEEVRRECVRIFRNRETLSALTQTETNTLKSLADRLTESGG